MTSPIGGVPTLGTDVVSQGPDNTASEITLYSITVPANTLKAGVALDYAGMGEIYNQSGAGRILTVRFYLGATVLCTCADGQAGSANKRNFIVKARVWGITGATQVGYFYFEAGAGDTVSGSGSNSYIHNQANNNSLAVDMTVDQIFKITGQWPVANASLYAKLFGSSLSIVVPRVP